MSLLPSWSSISFDHSWVEKLQDTTKIDWNKLLVDQYKAIVQEQITDENCKIMSTALYTLPLHMMNALEFNEVFDILTNKIFVTKRLLILGFEMGTKGQISNIEMLFGFESSNSIHTDEQRNDTKEVSTKFTATFCLNFFADIIWNFKDENQSSKSFCHGSSKSLVEVGRTLQKHSSWNEAMDCFYKGLKKMYKAGYDEKHADVIQILQLIKSSSPQRIVLVPFSSPHGLILTKSHILQQQNGQKVSLELISHPNCAIIPMSSKFISDKSLNFNPYIEIRCGPKENAMIVTYDGTFITRVDDGAVLSISFGWIKEGGSVALMKGPKTPKEKEEQKKISNGSRTFIVNMNGTISPASVPNLVLGIETYPILRLVKRNSPNIIIFRNAKLLNDCQSILKRSNDNVSSIGLDIISHPDLSLVAMLKDWIQVGPTSGSAIGLGPNNEMLQAQYLEDGQIYLPNEGGYLKVYDGNFCEGQAVCAVKTAAGFLLQKVTFIINHDGSISPSEAPHLGFGFYESVSSLETTVME